MQTKQPEPGGKRAAVREKFGFDLKFAYHVVRLLGASEVVDARSESTAAAIRCQLKLALCSTPRADISPRSRASVSSRMRTSASCSV